MAKADKHILLALTGKTPQVVTETLFGLMIQRRIPIQEVYLATTLEGKRAVLGQLQTPSLKEEIRRLCASRNVKEPIFDLEKSVLVAQEESVELPDIRSDRENRLFPNMITDIIRRLTADERTTLHCSLAGGRKTMSVAMAFALSLFGRQQDKLYHVLVSDRLEASKKFFPETPEEERELTLSEVPYVRMREKLSLLRDHPHASFAQLVETAQMAINDMMYLPDLVIDRANRTLIIGDKQIRLRPLEFAFYLFCAMQKRPVLAGKRFSDEKWKKFLSLYERHSPSYGHRERVRKTVSGNEREKLLTKCFSTIRRVLTERLGKELASHYAVSNMGQYGETRYTIGLERAKIKVK